MTYYIFSRSERYRLTFSERIEVLLSEVNSYSLPLVPWYIERSKVGSLKLRGSGSGIPLIHFRSYRSPIKLYGFFSGIAFRFRYFTTTTKPEDYLLPIECWSDLLPTASLDNLIDCINYYDPPNKPWFVLSNAIGQLSVRTGTYFQYSPAIDDYGNYFYGREEVYWLLGGIAYALCPK